MEAAKPAPVAGRVMISVRSSDLTVGEQQRVKAMQRLAHAPDRPTYLALQQEIGLFQAFGEKGHERSGTSDEAWVSGCANTCFTKGEYEPLFVLVNTLNVRCLQEKRCVKQSEQSFTVPSGCDSSKESL
jgi:hypothetical protein